MKKIILSAILVLGSTFAFTVNAQINTSFGVKLNGNLTNVKVSNQQNGSNSFKTGASLGSFAKIGFGEHFALQPELLFNYTERKTKRVGEETKFKYAAVEISTYAMKQFSMGRGKLFAGIGPNIGYGFSIDAKTEKLNDWEEGANKLELSHWYMGGGILAGYEFHNRISIHAGYKLGFDLSSGNKASGTDTQTISLGVSYRF